MVFWGHLSLPPWQFGSLCRAPSRALSDYRDLLLPDFLPIQVEHKPPWLGRPELKREIVNPTIHRHYSVSLDFVTMIRILHGADKSLELSLSKIRGKKFQKTRFLHRAGEVRAYHSPAPCRFKNSRKAVLALSVALGRRMVWEQLRYSSMKRLKNVELVLTTCLFSLKSWRNFRTSDFNLV